MISLVSGDVVAQGAFNDLGEVLAAFFGDLLGWFPHVVGDADRAVWCASGGWSSSLSHAHSVHTKNLAEQG